ncbi:MAG: class I SAM-dependent methyltransferase [Betaproteobacteria bacterium]|nr:class I SAM-dependent methyltransferase [Betaproteobacteria bacterium]
MKHQRRVEAYQQFVLDCKIYWSTQVYPELQTHYQQLADQARRAGQQAPTQAREAQALLADSTLYQFYAWYERHLQRMKYSGRLGLVPHFENERDTLEAWLAEADSLDTLELDPAFQPPRYYTSFDVHQHPKGLAGDSLAGLVYEQASRSTTPLLRRDRDLHHRFTAALLGRVRPKRMVDLGCGFGKSTRPFYQKVSGIELTALDLSEPCLRVAALNARDDRASGVRFLQRDAANTGLEAGRFDTVTSTMLLHELPPPHLERVVAESFRLLEPGGTVVHLDFLVPDPDPFKRFIHYSHGRRNNEPFMEPLNELDLVALHKQAGFTDVEILPFEEAEGTLAPGYRAWRFPWAMVIARK